MNTSHSRYSSLLRLPLLITLILLSCQLGLGQVRKVSARSAIVVDERLAALRSAPHLSAPFLKRISRGRTVTVVETRRSSDGVVFHRVAVTRRTRGWIQREALILPRRSGDDGRLLRLIKASRDFDRIARARSFSKRFRIPRCASGATDLWRRSEQGCRKTIPRRSAPLGGNEIGGTAASITSYFLNYSGLDRYRRQGSCLLSIP